MKENIIAVFVPLPAAILKRATVAKAWFRHTQNSIYMVSEAHITLQLAKYPKSKHGFDNLVRDLRESHLTAPTVIFSGVKTMPNKIDGNQFFFLGIRKTVGLYNFHKAILKIIKPHQKGLIRKKDMQRLREGRFSKQEIQNLQTYGYSRVLRFFNPHITFGAMPRTNIREQDKMIAILKKKLGAIAKSRFIPDHLIVGLYEYEPGKYTEVIQEVSVPLAKR